MKKSIRLLASLKLAVLIIVAIGILTAIGTFVEAKYDATAAKKLVYNTAWMYGVMGLLVINLTAVMVDRWPWKRRHAAFVCAHIGIIVILVGSLLTMKYGLDGNMRVGIGESSQFVQVPETDIVVYTSFDGDNYSKTFEAEVDYFLNRPSVEAPTVIPAFEGQIKIIEYRPYVIPSKKVVPVTEGQAGAGLRFQISNPNVNVIEWLVQRKASSVATHDFGPAKIHLGKAPEKGAGVNEIYISPPEKDGGKLTYSVFAKDQEKAVKTGVIEEGGVFSPGWMGLEVRVLRYMPKAQEDWELQDSPRPTPLTTAAVKVEFQGREHWVLQNDLVKLFTDKAVYLLSYANRRIDLGFPVKLNKFEVTRYQGTMKAMAYESRVEVPDLGEVLISMNEPLKFRGLTIYQASFEENEQGQPIASVFSVNHDPGRFLKYLGSLVMSIGIILLFHFKRLDFLANKKSRSST